MTDTTQTTPREEWPESARAFSEYHDISEAQAVVLQDILRETREEWYTRGRIDEAKTCAGCKENSDKIRAAGYEKGVRDALEAIPNEKNHFLYSRAETSGFKKCRLATEEAISALLT